MPVFSSDTRPESNPSRFKSGKSGVPFWKRKRNWALFVALLLIYPVVVSVALWSGLVEKVLTSEDLRVDIEKPAYSLIPGDFHLKSVKVYVNGETQFTLFADDIHARVNIFPLFNKVFSLSWLSAENVKYRMRVQHAKDNVEEPRVAAFPPLDGLPGVNTVSAEDATQAEERESPWTVRLNNLGVTVTELWFFEYRYLGSGKLKGGFEVGPQVMNVRTSVQKLGPGKLLYGEDHVISHNFRGHIQAKIPELNPSEHADLSFFDFVNADIELKADIVNLEHASAYIPNGDIRKGAGHLTILGVLERGALSKDTSVAFQTDEVEFVTDGLSVKSDIDLRISVKDLEPKKNPDGAEGKSAGPAPHLRSHSKVTAVTFSSEKMEPLTIQFLGHTEKAALASSKLDEEMKVISASVEIPSIVSESLKGLGPLSGGAVKSDEPGKAAAGLYLSMDEDGRFHGPFHADLRDLTLDVEPVKMSLQGRLKFQTSVDLANETLMLSGIEADARDVDFVIGDRKVDDWWLVLRGKKLWLDWANDQLTADASLASKSAEPIILAVAHEKKGVPKIAANLLKFPDVRSAAKLRRDGDTFDLMLEAMETDFIDFAGRVLQKDDALQLALLIGGKTLSLGLYKEPNQTDIMPMARTNWLNNKLELFPGPKEKVAPPKP